MQKLSTNLISAVLGVNVVGFRVDGNTLKYFTFDGDSQREHAINLYEFAHENCKEWAMNKGYMLGSGKRWSENFKGWCEFRLDNNDGEEKSYSAKTEVAAIFVSVNWLREQIRA